MIQIAIFAFVLLFAGCEKKETPKKDVTPVQVARVLQQDIPYLVKTTGELVSSHSVEIKPQVEGFLTQILFEDGQLVEEGDVLFRIDSSVYEAKVQQIEAQLAQNKAKLKYAQDYAQTYGSLKGEGYVSRLEYEQGMQNMDVCKAAIELDNAALKIAKINLGYTEIRAPFKGYVGHRKFDPGNYVTPSHVSLVTLNKITPLIVKFSVPCKYLCAVRQLQKKEPLFVDVTIPHEMEPLTGTLYCIDNAVHHETGTVLLRAKIPNLEEKGWPGQCVQVFLRSKNLENALLVPQSAILSNEVGHSVFVLDETTMTVHKKMIGKGASIEDYSVVEWGVNADDKVVLDGHAHLSDGAKVSILKIQKI